MNQVIVSGLQVGEDDLREFLAQTERLTGAKIDIVPQWVLTCANQQVQDALAKMFGAQAEGKPVKKGGRGKKAEPLLKLKPGKTAPLKSWRLLDADGNETGRLSKTQLTEHLLVGKFEPGQRLHHPQEGLMVVIGNAGGKQQLASQVG